MNRRIDLLRFPLIVGVAFIHVDGTTIDLAATSIGMDQSGYFSQLIRNFISQGLARIAVPLFFMMSGYLFFLDFEWSLDKYKRKIRNRISTLLVPFLFWNVLTLLLYAIAQSLPAAQVYFSGKNAPVSSFGFYDYLNALIGIDRPPISYQFWFIRDLMVMVLLVPILQLVLRTIPLIFLGFIFWLWFFSSWPIYIPSSVAFSFFYIGAFIAFSGHDIFAVDRYGKFFLGAYLAILTLDVLTKGHQFNGHFHQIGILLGIASALYATKLILEREKLKSVLLWMANCSFFVFAAHEPLLALLRKVSYKFLEPNTDVSILALYLLIPVVVLAAAILAYLVFRAIAPKFLNFVSGGR